MPPAAALSVSQFLASVNESFEAIFPYGAAVRGELAEFHVSQGKWVWFKLKDEDSVVDCFMTVWDLERSGLGADTLDDGLVVVAHGLPSVFPKSGRFSFKVKNLKLDGEGSLRRAYERLKAKLEAEGVFAPERKRALPRFPERIGIIASRESAAYTDFLRVVRERWPGARVSSAHVQVQGESAVDDIVGAFRWFNAHADDYDALVLTRGGGSMEDLQAFNAEPVVRAVFGSRLPVVCAVGHERDVTLADYAADLRAATPTHAAEVLVPDRDEVRARVGEWERRLRQDFRRVVQLRRDALNRSAMRLQSAMGSRVTALTRRLDAFAAAGSRYFRYVQDVRRSLAEDVVRLPRLAARRLLETAGRITAAERVLRAHDPRRPLALGYALVRSHGQLVRSAEAARAAAAMELEFRDGRVPVVPAKVETSTPPRPTKPGTLALL
jgi:exodeoxyribonuclease VII large subunit